jgi:hypothetical protein
LFPPGGGGGSGLSLDVDVGRVEGGRGERLPEGGPGGGALPTGLVDLFVLSLGFPPTDLSLGMPPANNPPKLAGPELSDVPPLPPLPLLPGGAIGPPPPGPIFLAT